jgi:signal transduction histidine kinase
MVSVRPPASNGEGQRARPEPAPKSAEPHLGLGLFIVRLIAEFHGGTATARNRADGRGVVVEVRFPVA